jgi:endonuclease/exonuclease/phosphatase family metal-dependent hydrolase
VKRFASLLLIIVVLTSLMTACNGPQKREEKVLRFLTQNVQLFPEAERLVPKKYAPTLASELEKRGLCKAKKERIPYISELIKPYKIVGLQEAFDEDAQNQILQAWYTNLGKKIQRKNNPPVVWGDHFVVGPHVQGTTSYTYRVGWLSVTVPVTKTNGGLMILTEHKIINAVGYVYKHKAPLSGKSLDAASNKGVIYARIQVSPSPQDYIHVFNTHLQAQSCKDCQDARKEQLKELRDFIKEQTKDDKDGHPIVVLGDFNINGEMNPGKDDEYVKQLQSTLLKPTGDKDKLPPNLGDAWKEKNPKSPGYTWTGNDQVPKNSAWGEKNVLAGETGKPERLDYFFYYGGASGGKWTLKPASVSLVPSEQRDKPYDLGKFKSYTVSDHLGVEMKCKVTYPAVEKKAGGETVVAETVEVEVEEVPPTPLPPTLTPTTVPPTSTPVPTATPAPEVKDYVEDCNALLEQGKSLLAEHEETGAGDCGEGIRQLRLAIEKATTALQLEPNNAAACFCRGMSRRWLEEELNEASGDLECAVEGLEGDERVEAENELAKLRERLAAPICVSIGPPIFAEDWKWETGEPINPGTTFPADSLAEIWARWELGHPCGELAVVKWYHDGELLCQHHAELEDWWDYTGSGWTADEEWIESGLWCVAVYIGDTKMSEGCFTIE